MEIFQPLHTLLEDPESALVVIEKDPVKNCGFLLFCFVAEANMRGIHTISLVLPSFTLYELMFHAFSIAFKIERNQVVDAWKFAYDYLNATAPIRNIPEELVEKILEIKKQDKWRLEYEIEKVIDAYISILEQCPDTGISTERVHLDEMKKFYLEKNPFSKQLSIEEEK